MFVIYDKDGNEYKIRHKVDVTSALKTGNYSTRHPGQPAPEVAPVVESVKAEVIEGVILEKEEKKEASGKKLVRPKAAG